MNQSKSEVAEPPENGSDNKKRVGFSRGIYIVFFWCLLGASLIYGVRLYFDVPIHPSFLPLVTAIVAAILAFTLIISFEYHVGPIELKLGENRGFSGAGGPIVLWCICFLVIVYGFYLLGITDAVKQEIKKDDLKACAVHDLIMHGECSYKHIQSSESK